MLTKPTTEARLWSGLFASNKLLSIIKKNMLDLVFPPMCHSCGRVDSTWCSHCLTELNDVPIQLTLRDPNVLHALGATGKHTGKLQDAIQALKYNQARDLAEPLAQRLITALHMANWTFDMIIPVPMFTQREAKRGYNQAYLLSEQVAKAMSIPCQPNNLTRHRDTNQQVGLNAQQRIENVKDAFVATDHVAGQTILIIDDVVTTGATLDACATALLDAGATTVYALTISHA